MKDTRETFGKTVKKRSLINFSIMIVVFLFLGGSDFAKGQSGPTGPTDESKIPHYFGPYPNWANSPLTMPDAQVVITGNGSGAEAVATVGAGGIITDITVTNPGHGYSRKELSSALR
jgi:hypothetical protein